MKAPVPSVLDQRPDAVKDREYEALAHRLGVQSRPSDSGEILQDLLSSKSIGVYDLQSVSAYLTGKAPAGTVFAWLPALKTQPVAKALMTKFPRVKQSTRYDIWSRRVRVETPHKGHISKLLYTKPIPYPALQTMNSILEEAPAANITPVFYVSDFVQSAHIVPAKLDPFLAVGTVDSSVLFVIERWDEPGFREAVYSQKRIKASKK